MRFRLGLVIGFGAGYYLGAMAGRERFEQINDTLRKIKGSETFEVTTDKAREVVDAGVDKATDLIDHARGHNGDEPAPVAPAAVPPSMPPGPSIP